MFEGANGDFDIQKKHINDKGEWVITAGLNNNGILGKSDVKAKIFDSHTLTVDMFGCAFYRQFPYKIVTHARVFSLRPKFDMTERGGLFIVNALNYLKKIFGYENMCSWEKIKNNTILLPTKNKKIDFAFMEQFIAELEAERIAELEAYLSAAGLTNTLLTGEEQRALEGDIEFKDFCLEDLFDSCNGDFDIQKKHINGKGDWVITAGLSDNGILGKSDVAAKIFAANTLTVDMFGNVFYRQFAYKIVTHARVFSLRPKFTMSQKIGLFFASSLKYLPTLFGYNNMCSWNKTKNLKILLPAKDNAPDFAYMETLISAVQKLVVKDVADCGKQKAAAYEQAATNPK